MLVIRLLQTATRLASRSGSLRLLAGLLALAPVLLTAAEPAGKMLAGKMLAGIAKVDVTDYEAGPVNDPLYVKVVALKSGETMLTLISVDAVAIGELGRITNDYLPTLRERMQKEVGIPPEQVLVNASHCHGIIRTDLADKTMEAVKAAVANMVPVRIGAGIGQEDRIMENRRLRLKNGKEVDVRHAYALPPDTAVGAVAPTDPEIGILKIEREDGTPLAVIYNFACHPIQGVPGGANTADIIGFASKVIEENLGEGTLALFLQGCAGDINPAYYKDVDHPRSAEPLGNLLGLSTLRAIRTIKCQEDPRLVVHQEHLTLPRGDRTERIGQLEAEQRQLLQRLRGTSLSFKTFFPLMVKYEHSPEYPSYYSHRYLYDDAQERKDLRALDAENRKNMEAYLENIYTMEELTRVQTNLALLRKHQAKMVASGKRTVDVELLGLRIGDFVMVTFPGELTSPIGLNIKKKSPHDLTFVAGYTNGYIYYAPTAEQLHNIGGAQEDSDCILAPEWQEMFETKAAEMLRQLTSSN